MFPFNSPDSGNFDCQFSDSVISMYLCRYIKEQLKIYIVRERKGGEGERGRRSAGAHTLNREA